MQSLAAGKVIGRYGTLFGGAVLIVSGGEQILRRLLVAASGHTPERNVLPRSAHRLSRCGPAASSRTDAGRQFRGRQQGNAEHGRPVSLGPTLGKMWLLKKMPARP